MKFSFLLMIRKKPVEGFEELKESFSSNHRCCYAKSYKKCSFLTHNNYDRPFIVDIENNIVKIYQKINSIEKPDIMIDKSSGCYYFDPNEDINFKYYLIAEITVDEMFIGASRCELDEFHIGNSALFSVKDYKIHRKLENKDSHLFCIAHDDDFDYYWYQINKTQYYLTHIRDNCKNLYCFVGHSFALFNSPEKILEFDSEVGNNDVPYPWASTENYNIWILEKFALTSKQVSCYRAFWDTEKNLKKEDKIYYCPDIDVTK